MDKYFMFHGDICWKDENDHFHPVTYVEILKILNENESRKNHPRIDKETKKVALDCLKAIKIYGIRPTDYDFEYLNRAIEIISNLPTGD